LCDWSIPRDVYGVEKKKKRLEGPVYIKVCIDSAHDLPSFGGH
jgi:hypothetical protein